MDKKRKFSSGAVRDVAKGKGRCDLLPAAALHKWTQYDEENTGIYVTESGKRMWKK